MDTFSVRKYLRESNAIENVHDEDALDAALDAWDYLQNVDELTHDVVKETHRLLLEDRQPNIAGEYREIPVRVGDDTPPPPGSVTPLLDHLFDTVPETAVETIDWHVNFEKVHPFRDGNGRVGRLLYLWHCRELLGVDPVMWRVDDVSGYYSLFQTTSAPSIE